MRPREKLTQLGVQNLTYSELVHLLLSTGSSKRSVDLLASEIANYLERSIEEEQTVSLSMLEKFPGVGQVKSMRLLAALELGKRVFGNKSNYIIDSAQQAFQVVRHIAEKRQEYLYALYLNARYELIYKRTIFIGKVDSSLANPREIFSYAFLKNAYNIILAHNHPSGDLQPSLQDIETTQTIVSAGKLIGIAILDHLIVGANGYRSMKELELL